MIKKVLLTGLVILTFSQMAFAKRPKDERNLGPENSWQETFDINDKKPGKYNILVTGEDKAGNQEIAGPYNIYIDPESDLPVTGITNPSRMQRVPGNLNVVGTCVDDDKVTEVWLIFDGDEENPVKAEGTEFWSYFLPTTDLLEGPHTIEAYGIDDGNPDAYRDVNGVVDQSKVIPKTGYRTKVTWNLDRRLPVTEVQNMTMGQLVSGKINLDGRVTDGNSIVRLEYSLDGGVHFEEAKLKEIKYKNRSPEGLLSEFQFSVSIDTSKFPDGAATCWFRATDGAGSVGRYAFLYFIDNSSPDLRVLSPAKDEEVNGVFSVTGYAKDTIGIEKLTWQWENQTGEFELTPGNPYWTKEIDARSLSSTNKKGIDFTVTATDTIGNVTVVKHPILINQEADKPVVKIEYPTNGLDLGFGTGEMFLRGIATDDDGVVSLSYSIDNGAEKTIDCTGVFYASFEDNLPAGRHSVTVKAQDKYGVRGNPVTVDFISRGAEPSISKESYRSASGTSAFANGMTVNPEADGSFEATVSCDSPLSRIEYGLYWGTDGAITGSQDFSRGEKESVVRIPLYGDDIPWGTARISISATDIYDRVTEKDYFVDILDLSHVHTDEPGVYFDDSTVSADGKIIAGENAVTGYFAGGKISSVVLDPAQKSVKNSFKDHVIQLESAEATGEFSVVVTTDSGARYRSRKLSFIKTPERPVLRLKESPLFDTESGLAFQFETEESKLKIEGTVSVPSARITYRILSVKAEFPEYAGGLLMSSAPVANSEDKEIRADKNGAWSIDGLGFDSFVDGVSVVEIVAENGGLTSGQAVFVRKIPYAPIDAVLDDKGKPLSKDSPRVYWLTGHDYYGVCVYQGSVDQEFKYIKSENLSADSAPIVFTVTPTDVEAPKKPVPVSSQPLSAFAPSSIKGKFILVDNVNYASGMEYRLERNSMNGKEGGHFATIGIKTNGTIRGVSYSISGPQAPGGQVSQTGAASAVRQISADPDKGVYEYEADIPLANLPARITKISAVVTDSRGQTGTIDGYISVVREHHVFGDGKGIFWAATEGSPFDKKLSSYVIDEGKSLFGYAAISGSIESVALNGKFDGLSVTAEGKTFAVKPEREGSWKDVSVTVKGKDGGSYTSKYASIVSDFSAPALAVTSPVAMEWTKEKFTLSGKVSDASGIEKLEYSLGDRKAAVYAKEGLVSGEEVQEWKAIPVGKDGSFSVSVDLSSIEDGYVPLSVRAIDTTGKESYAALALQKDTAGPEVRIVVPDEETVVNGENEIAFIVKDNGRLAKIGYESADGKLKESYEIFVKPEMVPEKTETREDGTSYIVSDRFNPLKTLNSSMPNLRIGTKERPIDNKMKFTFTDANGNSTVISEYPFTVDEESDKPVAEIHLPEELQVLTTDFIISGVVYDDDGPCHMYYKIDNGEYQLVNEELSSSYKVGIPLSSMTDNEHTVTVYAVDINGVKGDETVRKFRISLEEPKGGMTEPPITETVRETVTLKGWASDKNGISKVQISVDNGASYNDAVGTTEWSYKFDTRVIQDGTHVVFIKIYDGYEITGLYSSLINIDNTPPSLKLDFPLDDSKTSKNLFFSGQTTDNIELTSLYLTLRSLEGKPVPQKFAQTDLQPEEIITQVMDVSELQNGFYNIQLTGTDAAGNITRVSRNIEIDKTKPLTKVNLLYPLNGEHINGEFNIYGTSYGEKDDPVEYVELFIDSRKFEEVGRVELTPSGYFKFPLKPSYEGFVEPVEDELGNTFTRTIREDYRITEGEHQYQVIATTRSGKKIISNSQTFIYSPYGPWLTLDTFTYGDFARNRPLLKGNAGYNLRDSEINELKLKTTLSDRREVLEAKKIKGVYLSFDNGKTYIPVSKPGKGNWQYRIENLDIPAGYHFMLVKAEMLNGEKAITRTIVQIDRTKPFVKLIAPGEGGRYNQELSFEGLSSDDVDLKDVKLTLRPGDKSSYEVPKFIQGLYFDVAFWGATLYNVGVGLTAFDGAVKVQASFGQFTQSQRDSINQLLGNPVTSLRFGGNVFSGKIIAQLAYIPFRYFFGRDWDWLSATVAIGANFSYFTESGASSSTGKSEPQLLSAALMQIEFPRVTVENMKKFKTWALYSEPQVWFIPSDVASDDAKKMVFTVSFGMRVSVF